MSEQRALRRYGIDRRHAPSWRGVLLAVAALMLLAVPGFGVAQDAAPSGEWDALTTRLEAVAVEGPVDELRLVRQELLQLLLEPSESVSEATVRYAIGYVDWRLSNRESLSPADQRDLLEDAVTHLEEALDQEPQHAEALALLGAVYAQQIGRNPERAMVLGARSGESLERAGRIEPENPRVLVHRAVSAFFTPVEFGGSVDTAERLLRLSIAQFDAEAPDTPWPNWGRFEAHVWLGQVLARQEQFGEAREQYELALEVVPESQWVQRALIPALEGR